MVDSEILELIERGDFAGRSAFRLRDKIDEDPGKFHHLVEKVLPFTLHHDGYVRESAAVALGLFGDDRAEDALIALLENESFTEGSWNGDNDWEARVEAAQTLAKLGGNKSIIAFEQLIKNHEHDVFVKELKNCMTAVQKRLSTS